MQPDYWPEELIYTAAPFSEDLHPAILSYLFSTGKEEDLTVIHPLIEQRIVHPYLEIRLILDKTHPLFSPISFQRGLFAKKKIPLGTDLGIYAGKISLKNREWGFEKNNYNYSLVIPLHHYYYVIDSKKWANEIVLMNDYRGLAKAPNVQAVTRIHRGCYYPMFSTLRMIMPDEELLWDYGKNYWKKHLF